MPPLTRFLLFCCKPLGSSALSLNPNSEIETADSADFTDFKGVIGVVRTNLFLVKLQGVYNCNLLYPCNLRNLRLNPFSVFGFKQLPQGEIRGVETTHSVNTASWRSGGGANVKVLQRSTVRNRA